MLVSGYVRLNSITDIPFAIIQIYIAFFLCMDQWYIHNTGKYLKISGIHNEIVKCTNPKPYPGNNCQTRFIGSGDLELLKLI